MKELKKMKILYVNPHEYNYAGYHQIQTYPTDLYNSATLSKRDGHDVDIVDLHPEGQVHEVAGVLQLNGMDVVRDTKRERRCGNYDNEKYFKGILRCGLSIKILEDKLNKNEYDRIVVGVLANKTAVTTTSWSYVYTAVSEIIDICKDKQPNSNVVLIGEFAKICSDVAKGTGADEVSDKPSSGRNFVDTDLSLFEDEYFPRRVNIATSYGCHNSCAFCFVPKVEGLERSEKPVEDVLRYIEYCVNEGVTKFRFIDSNLLCNWDKHLKLILEGIIAKGWNLDLTSYGGVEPAMLTQDIATTMVNAGFKTINVPLDSSDPTVLMKFGGTKTVENWEKAADIAVATFSSVSTYIMIGLPGQKYEDVIASINKCKEKGTEPTFLPFTPIPGTYLEDKDKHPGDIHPLLFPYASPDLTVKQIETLLEQHTKWYKKTAICMDTAIPRIRVYRSSPPITII